MYKYLLCWRYLRTRYIALASVVSVMLGVATMIVVNAVMAGFAEKMRDRLHGVLADVVVESNSFDGFHHPDEVMALVKEVGGDRILAQAPAVETPGMLAISLANGELYNRPVQIIGIRPEERARVGDFAEFLVDENDRRIPASFAVGRDLKLRSRVGRTMQGLGLDEDDPFRQAMERDLAQEVPDQGAIVGYALATVHRMGTDSDQFLTPRGDKVVLTFPTAGRKTQAATDDFTVVGFFKSGMSEYDSQFVYIPLDQIQRLRGLGDAVNMIQVRVRPGTDLDALAAQLNAALYRKWPYEFRTLTWEQKQGPLLAAVSLEQSILNLLLFFIIAVAGFGILAIFFMIVVEKTRDIGILKALGASTAGVRGIFLGYGLSLGLVGSGVGMAGGLLFVRYINAIEHGLSVLTGRKVFDGDIYYFNEIPTQIQAWTVGWIVGGALLIAVAASVWPAQRAARLHPVQALRNE